MGSLANTTHDLRQYCRWTEVPPGIQTRKHFLKQHHRRVRKDARPVGTILLVFDHPRSRQKGIKTVPADECAEIRQELQVVGWSPRLSRLDAAGQLAVCNLYHFQDTEPIERFKESEAQTLLEYWLWDGSHLDHYITETPAVEGVQDRKRATWKYDYSVPTLSPHLEGARYYGTKKGDRTRLITIDIDRHNGSISGDEHCKKVLKIGSVLQQRFADYRFAPEVNPRNGSVKFFGWLKQDTPIAVATHIGETIRATLQIELPEYDLSRLEIFPENSPQVFAPLRADKIMILGDGVVKKVRRWHGKAKTRHYYDAYSCAVFVNWVVFSKSVFDMATFEKVLREAVGRCPDTESITPLKPKCAKRATNVKTGLGDTGKWKNCTARKLVDFWRQNEIPADDTIDIFLTVTARVLKAEGMSRVEAEMWITQRLEGFKQTEFSDRLTDDPEELFRVLGHKLDRIWTDNGYQLDAALSDMKLKESVRAWTKKGFQLSDPETWDRAQLCGLLLVWTPRLYDLRHDVQNLTGCTPEQAKAFVELVLSFVHRKAELAYSMVGRLLTQVGIKGQSHARQGEIISLLRQGGFICKTHNHHNDNLTGYRHGAFYICGADVVHFEGEATTTHTTHTVSIDYLPLEYEPLMTNAQEINDFLREGRRLEANRLYRERIRQLRRSLQTAA